MRTVCTLLFATALLVPTLAFAAPEKEVLEPIVVDGHTFSSWLDYGQSDYFRNAGKRCGTPAIDLVDGADLGGSDCSSGSTNPDPIYDPGADITINVVVHVITNSTMSQGNLTDAQVESQIEILNEDFLALAGSNGENGTYGGIVFQLATEDPNGDPTNGITRSANTTWFNDSGSYWNTLAWDPNKYLNIYTNLASGALGYVPFLPASSPGSVGTNSDRVVCLWSAFGRDAPFFPYHQGRTVTHEVGHYLGLYHVFQSGCGTQSMPGCYSTGDRICDTNGDQTSHFGCPNTATCGTPDPIDNYMEYTDDLCMEKFTPEQVNRMRCTIETYRPNLVTSAVSVAEIRENSAFTLEQNRPNPFGPATDIAFTIAQPSNVPLKILDVTGRSVKVLTNGTQSAGRHTASWDGTDRSGNPVAAGVYFYQLQTDVGEQTRRMILKR